MNTNQREFNRTTHIGSLVDIALTSLKIGVGLSIHSHALVADGIHSLTDLMSNVFILIVGHISKQQADENHPYGHGRFETLGTIILGAFIILTGGIMAWETLQNLFLQQGKPHILLANHDYIIIMVIAFISFVAKEWIYRWTKKVGQKLNSAIMIANAYHARSDAFSSLAVLFAGPLGLMGVQNADSFMCVIVSILIIKMGIMVIIPAAKEIVDTLPDKEIINQIDKIIMSNPHVTGHHHLRARHVGSDIVVDVNIEVDPYISVSEGHEIAANVARNIKESIENINDVLVHIDIQHDHQGMSLSISREDIWKAIQQHDEIKVWLEDPKQLIIHYHSCEKVELDIYLHEKAPVNLIDEHLQSFSWVKQVRFWHRLKHNYSGQTIVEYVLVVAVMATLTMSVMMKFKNWMVGKSECPNQSFICRMQQAMLGEGYLNGNYRNFKLLR